MRLVASTLRVSFVLGLAAALAGAQPEAQKAPEPKPADLARARDRAVLAADSGQRGERVAALRQLVKTPDARALPALQRLSKRQFSDPAEREEAWEQIATVVNQVVAEGDRELKTGTEIDPALVAFLESIVERPPEVTYVDDQSFDFPARRARFEYRERARSALSGIALRKAKLQLDAELAALPPEQRASHLAEVAWTRPESPRDLAYLPAREKLEALGATGLSSSRAVIGRAPPDGQQAMVAYLADRFGEDPDTVRAALVELAGVPAEPVWSRSLTALRDLRPAGAAQPLVEVLEARSEPARTRLALDALGALADPAAIPFVTRALRSGDVETSLAAARALAEIGPGGLEPLLAALRGEDPTARRAAVFVLAGRNEPAVRAALDAFVGQTDDAELRRWVLERRTP